MENKFLIPFWKAFEKFPDYPAILDRAGERTMTYKELESLVRRVVAYIKKKGIVGRFIPILMESSAEYIAVEIGIWSSGNAAVPMGPSFPPERIEYIVNHCEAPFCIDSAVFKEMLKCEEEKEFDFAPMEQDALLVYTSGSTGNPKGIIHTFASLAAVHAKIEGVEYGPGDQWAMAAPPYFIAYMSVFKPLKMGATLHLLDTSFARDVNKLSEYFDQHNITHTFISPAVLPNFHSKNPALKIVFTGSEKLVGQASREGYTLFNCYGMSETCGTVMCFEVKTPYESTPVGIPSEEWALLDDDGKPVPEGEEGELCLKGVFCRGYYKDQEKTDALYRGGWLHTNDLMRRTAEDGPLIYVNRKDWMVKINGQRVEPGEVESAIRKLAGVKQVVVKGFENETGSQYLCAFFVGEAEGDALKHELAKTLPPYMVPLHFVHLDQFAYLPNGKVNRKVLLPPETTSLAASYAPPTNDVEQSLCEAFQEIFHLEKAGLDDDFFLLGGDSIKVMRLQQLCPDLGLSSKLIYKERTPRNIAATVLPLDDLGTGEIPESSPLSQTQLGIYAESMAHQGEAVYNNPILLKLGKGIDPERLAKALTVALNAHKALFIHIEERDGEPKMIRGERQGDVQVEEVEDMEALKARLVQPFDLSKGPLYRINVFKSAGDVYLFIDIHHIIFDGTSMRIYMNDVNRAYEGKEVLPERFTAFDIASREAKLRKEEGYAKAKEWYEATFGGLDVESLPLADKDEQEVVYKTATDRIEIPFSSVELLCKRAGVTANVFATAVFAKLLASYSNTRDALFATIYNGRDDLLTARTMAMMVKTLPVYASFTEDETVADFLKAVKEQLLLAMENDIYSFAEVSASTGITSEVLFAYQGDYLALGTVCGVPFERVMLDFAATGSPLDVQVYADQKGVTVNAQYQANRYSDAFMQEFVTSYCNVLKSFLIQEKLSCIEVVNEKQIAWLDSLQGKDVAYDEKATVLSKFLDSVKRYGDQIAVVYQDASYTYKQIDEYSTRLAALIAKAGAKKGDVVSILIDRGPFMPIASFAAMKAGCAYQPLDATYPKERLNFMAKDASCAVVVTMDTLRPLLSEYEGPVVLISTPEALPATNYKPVGVAPEDLMILLYTSGSTGVPKGCRLLQRNLVAFLDFHDRSYEIDSSSCVSAYASYGFDASMMDVYSALTCGAKVAIIPEEMRLDLSAMTKYMQGNGVTHAFFTTQVGRAFGIDGVYPGLKYLYMGGEKLIAFPLPETTVCRNIYGPSETTVYVTDAKLTADQKVPPLGRVNDNTRGYVVGLDGNRLPMGALGELWIAGPQVGDGYLNRPEKTAEVFIDNPFEGGKYIHLYKTGDIVRYKADGDIEFVGRRDGQVKVRGFRIELSEVEAVIREFPGVKDATIAAFDHPAGGKYIAAYIVFDGTLDTAALTAFIKDRKPPYMVPSAFVTLNRIPLNQNGKVNKRVLPVPEFKTAKDGGSRPLNPLEKRLKEIVADCIGEQSIGVSDPLIEAGLTSITSIRLAVAIQKEFGIDVPSKELLSGISIADIASALIEAWMKGGASKANEQPKVIRESAPLSYPQMGVYYECLKHPDSLAYNMPTRFIFEAAADPLAIKKAILEVTKAHPTLFAHFATEGDETVQRIGKMEPPIEILTLDEAAYAEYEKGFLRPFDLAKGPLCRFAIVKLPNSVNLLADFHHLGFDGASMSIFLNDLSTSMKGKEVEEERYGYLDFAAKQKEDEQSPEFAESKAYFDKLFADFESSTEVPADTSAKEEEGKAAIATSPFDLKTAETLAKKLGVTPAAVALSAVFYALSRYANERHVYASTISSGRSDTKLSNTVGMFVNTIPLASEIQDITSGEFVKNVADMFAGAIAHEGYPFARIAADYGFQPNLVYEYQLGIIEKIDIPGCKSIAGMASDDAKFRLAVHIEEKDGAPLIAVYYNDAIYAASTANGFARSIGIALSHIAEKPEGKIRQVSLIDEEREAVLKKFRVEEEGPLPYKTYHAFIEASAKKYPNEVALIANDGEFTFKQFNEAANRIAHGLIDLGVKPQSRVVLLLPRTSRAILSMFGVLKAGCAYIPCDPAYPEERVKHILEDSKAPYVITTADRLSSYSNAIDVETLVANANSSDPCIDISPEDLAYLIYTSGSTGKPKGVMIRHKGVVNYIADAESNIMVKALKEKVHRFLSLTTISFDMSVKEIGIALALGKGVVFADESQTNDPQKIVELFEATGANAINATHSRLRQYMELPAFREQIGKCDVVTSGGEKYPEGFLQELQAATKAIIINTYGPTETTVSCNMKDLTKADKVSVGRPLYNVIEFVVDSDGNELPAGIVGELYIGGLGVSAGYNDLPKQTAERFIEYKGMRVYRSGDYSKWTDEGDVVILGRTDNQIKLRGLRIELGEVEAAINKASGIKSAVVKIMTLKGQEHLCAYFTAESKIEISALREEIGKTLTKYMVPTAYLQLDKLPLTPNGKVDMKSLPEPELFSAGDHVAAANALEESFCDIFAHILGLSEVGATDSFFDIGGTSLSAIQVTVEAAKQGYTLAYADVFANPSPRELALFCGGGEEPQANEDFEFASYNYDDANKALEGNTLEAFMKGEKKGLGNILLTGAAGYLGIHILHEYLEHYDGIAYCLLRSKKTMSAERRLIGQLFYYFEKDYSSYLGSRIVVVEGDITKPIPDIPKGLPAIDAVINCAAVVKHFSASTEIEDINVGGVLNLIDYCVEKKLPLIQISTASTVKAALLPDAKPVLSATERQLYIGQTMANKYVRSKFLAERAMLEAVTKRGLVGKIMRVGNLAPRASDGEFQINYSTNSSMGRLKSFSMIGCVPFTMLDNTMEFSPIDEVAQAILLLSATPKENVLFHPVNPHRVLFTDIFASMRDCGLPVKPVEPDEFVKKLEKAEEDPEKAQILTSLLAYKGKANIKPPVIPTASTEFTMQVLYRLGFRWSPTSNEYVDQFLKALNGLGFFDIE